MLKLHTIRDILTRFLPKEVQFELYSDCNHLPANATKTLVNLKINITVTR